MRSVVDRNVVMRRIPVTQITKLCTVYLRHYNIVLNNIALSGSHHMFRPRRLVSNSFLNTTTTHNSDISHA